MKAFSQLLNHPDTSFSPISDGFEVSSPATSEALVFVRTTHSDGPKLLIQKAEAVQKLWVVKTAPERADVLWRWYFLIKENKEELVRIMAMEQGRSLNEALGETDYAASFVRWFAEEARRIDGDVLTSVKASQKLVVLKQPIGATAAIAPWNSLSTVTAHKTASALAVGCAMIVKPASFTPLNVYALALLTYEAGVPHDSLPAASGRVSEISHEFATNPTIRKTSFIGSTEVDARVFANNAADTKRFSLELEDGTPFIVFDDADLGKVVKGAITSRFHNSGQACVCTNRVYAQFSICDRFCRELSEEAAALKLDNGLGEGVNQGPLTEEKTVEEVEQHIADALSKGAVCLTGGKRSALSGMFFEPTVLNNVTTQTAVARREASGPLCPVFCFEIETGVVAATNDTEHGLAAYLFISDTVRQWRVDEALGYGMVSISTGLISNEVAPSDDVKRSGLGREDSKYGADEYLELKYLCIDVAG